MSTPAKRGLVGAIKAGQAYLGWDDVTYRSVLSRLCNGKTSSTKCTLLPRNGCATWVRAR